MTDGPRIPDPSPAAESPAAAQPTSAVKQRRDTWYGLAALSVGLGTWGLIGGWLLGYPLGGETHPDPFEGRWSLGSFFRTIPHPALADTPLVPPNPTEPRYRKRDNDRAILWTPRPLAAAGIEQPQQQQQQKLLLQQQQVANAPAPTGKGPAEPAAAPIEFAQAYDTNLSDSLRVVTVRAPRPVACLSIGSPAIASLPPTCLVYPPDLPLNRPVALAPSRMSAPVTPSRVSYPFDGLVDRERMHVALLDGAAAGPAMPSTLTFSRSDDNFALWIGASDRLLRIVPRSDDLISVTAFDSPVSGAPIDLILFVTSTRGWLFTANDDDRERRTGQPAVAVTSDGGVTWQRLWHRWLPAPWVFGAFLIGMFAFERGTRAQAALRPVAAKRHITDHGVSDDPIGLDDADALGLIPISTALSRFLRNFETKPTLAVAVTGPWGAGKSSLMNLVREDLVDRGVCTVWFNAWHYQKEDSLLAALLAAIRAQAVPPVWTPAGINYRMRVGLRRITLDPARAVAFFILALLAALLFWRYGSVVLDVLSQLKGKDGEAAGAAPPVPKPEAGGMLASTLAALGLSATGLGGLVLAVKKVWDLFRPLSSLPGDLLASLSGTTKTTDLDQQLSFRHRFQKEFSTFCDVLRWPPYPGLVIFIDDLDRCAPRQTVDVLEAINFVTNAGKCFVILGFDESKVKAAIADIYKDMTLKIDDVAEEKYARADTEGLVRFASQYLQKLVHLTIPVPASSKDTVEKLLGLQTVLPPSPQERRWRRWRRTAVETVAAMIFTTVVASGAWLAMDVIVRVSSTAAVTPEPQKQAVAKAEPRSARIPGSAAPAPLPVPAPVSPYLTPEDLRRTGLLADNELGFVPPSIVVTAFILILALFGVQFVPRLLSADSAVHDSPEFISALKIWVEAIGKRRATPRDVKRFVNRLRFLAMRLRDLQEEADKAKKPLGLDETRLVSFAAIEDLGEDMLGRSERELAADQAGPRAREIQAIVAKGMREYQGTFEKSLYDDPQMLEAYRRIAGTVIERSNGTIDPPPVRLAAEAGRGAPA